jgi:hypothetical protein
MWMSRNHPAGVSTVTFSQPASASFMAVHLIEVSGLRACGVDVVSGNPYAANTTMATGLLTPALATGTAPEFVYGVGSFEVFTPTVAVANPIDYGSGDGTPTALSNAQGTGAAGGIGIVGASQIVIDGSKTYGFSWPNPGQNQAGAIAAFAPCP